MIQSLPRVSHDTVIGAGGDISDFQYIRRIIDELMFEKFTAQDGHEFGPAVFASHCIHVSLRHLLIDAGVENEEKYVHNLVF